MLYRTRFTNPNRMEVIPLAKRKFSIYILLKKQGKEKEKLLKTVHVTLTMTINYNRVMGCVCSNNILIAAAELLTVCALHQP